MILNALCEYYDLMSEVEDSGISPYGFQTTKANYAAVISEDGELKDIISLNQSNNKQPQLFNMPMSLKKPGIGASPVCDNFEYIFGITGEKGEKELSEKKFMSAKMLHIEMFKDADSIEAKAIMNYFKSWDINKAWQNESILKHYSDKGKAFSGNVVFRMTGSSCYFHQVKEIEKIWLAYNEKEAAINGATIAQCSVTGQNAPIARLHRQFNGVEGASTMGASLVCFNKDSDESYGLEQSKNSAVSEQVVFKYGTALQHMLANVKQKIMIGDATTVFWAGAADNSYIDIFSYMLNKPDEQGEDSAIEDIKTRDMVKSILQDGIAGIYNDTKIDPLAKFYILGLSPNAGRISVRFFYQNSFASFCEKIKQHYDDVAIYGGKNGRQHIKIGSLLYATISSKSKDKKLSNDHFSSRSGMIIFKHVHYC